MSSHEEQSSIQEDASTKFSIQPSSFNTSALQHIARDAVVRTTKVATHLSYTLFTSLTLLPSLSRAQSTSNSGYTNLNTTHPQYEPFVAGPVDGTTPDGQKVLADMANFLATDGIKWYTWKGRVDQIRMGGDRASCVGNLSMALAGVGAAYQAGSSGAATLLTLLPTAGALIGTPTKELWILYKLMPVAGILSMVLSLGGNIVPSNINDYTSVATDPLNYNGMVASKPIEHPNVELQPEDVNADLLKSIPERERCYHEFAERVAARARNRHGSRRWAMITFGILNQIGWIACILIACWFMQSGTIVVWWCTFYPFMWSWYACVAVSSILDSIAGVPFTKQWTIRVSRAPKIEISEDAPWVIPDMDHEMASPNLTMRQQRTSSIPLLSNDTPKLAATVTDEELASPYPAMRRHRTSSIPLLSAGTPKLTTTVTDEEIMPLAGGTGNNVVDNGPTPSHRSVNSLGGGGGGGSVLGFDTDTTYYNSGYTAVPLQPQQTQQSQQSQQFQHQQYQQPRYYSRTYQPYVSRGYILEGLEKGYNTFGRIAMDPTKGWSAGDNAFYVIISVRGVSPTHAALRVFSKLLSIGVYTVGTAMFASSTLATILVAVVVASMVIVAGVFGRVTAMWMTSELMKDMPLLNAIAKDRRDAERYIEAMLRKPDMVFEVLGHVIIDGRCVKRLKPIRWSKFFGVIAPPFDITKLAMMPFRGSRV